MPAVSIAQPVLNFTLVSALISPPSGYPSIPQSFSLGSSVENE